ncbi:MAG: T9SS type A sorting domain-containing protein, partial [Flavobacteriales bacterium]|nr:T9SS type A sorting domain-containing protein [Flavobacteriales bacterium]
NIESEEEIKRISIYDLQGRLVKRKDGNQMQIELPQRSGMYLLKVELEHGRFVNRKVLRR